MITCVFRSVVVYACWVNHLTFCSVVTFNLNPRVLLRICTVLFGIICICADIGFAVSVLTKPIPYCAVSVRYVEIRCFAIGTVSTRYTFITR
ncbi:MAG: hypothetical protein EOM35_06395 [Negativicutes bacterium]|nr:hypothetical protein [Negativicutes bacterium]